MSQLGRFTLRDMTEIGSRLRKLNDAGVSMEEVAGRITQCLYQVLQDGDRPACKLVRFFKTHSYGSLPVTLQHQAKSLHRGPKLLNRTKCLTLLATTGAKPEWNSRALSQGHQAIPLVSEEMVAQAPMISQLIRQMGLDVRSLLQPRPEILMDTEQRTYNVFHVPEALASEYVPAQDFVAEHGIRSVLGVGGLLPSGNLFAVILFSMVPIPRETADLFRTLTLSIKLAVLPFDEGEVFTPEELGSAA